MALISGVLKGPYGDSRSGVTITMRSMKTSSTVLNLAKSQSVTDDTGRYSLNVEPGAYEVIVSVYGAQPERVGTIEVYVDSLPGTLNDFLRRPGEDDITPEIVQTVDRLRDKAALSAAAAKVSESNAAIIASTIGRPSQTEPVRKTYLTFIDDDTRIETYTYWKRLADETGIKITLATVPNWVNGNFPAGKQAMSLAQLREMYDEGHDLASHGYDTLTIQENLDKPDVLYTQLHDARQWLIDKGFTRDGCYDNFIWPQGLSGDTLTQRRAKSEVRKYYRYAVNAFSANKYMLPGVFDSYNMVRPFGDGQAPAAMTAWLDSAIARNGWMIVGSHAWHAVDQDGGNYDTWSARYRTLIEHAKAKGVEIVTLSQGLKLRGNASSVGEWLDAPNCCYINNDGSQYPAIFNFGVGGVAKMLSSTNTLTLLKTLGTGYYAVNAPAADMPNKTAAFKLDWTLTATSSGGHGILVATEISAKSTMYRKRLAAGVWGEWVKAWDAANTTVDANGFIKSASPIVRLCGAPEKMADNFLADGFTLAGFGAVNGEATGVNVERVSTGIYKVTGSLGLSTEGWTVEVAQDVNGNRLCFVETDSAEDGTITVKVSKRRFDIDTAAIVAGEPMDIPAGRWIDLRLEMPAREVEAAPEAVEETASLENVNVDPI